MNEKIIGELKDVMEDEDSYDDYEEQYDVDRNKGFIASVVDVLKNSEKHIEAIREQIANHLNVLNQSNNDERIQTLLWGTYSDRAVFRLRVYGEWRDDMIQYDQISDKYVELRPEGLREIEGYNYITHPILTELAEDTFGEVCYDATRIICSLAGEHFRKALKLTYSQVSLNKEIWNLPVRNFIELYDSEYIDIENPIDING